MRDEWRSSRAAEGLPSRKFVILSGYHDYRSKRRVNLHFIADELAKLGSVTFLSLRYSLLTRLGEDPRHDLWNRSNRWETANGIDCYLLRTLVHACRLPSAFGMVESALFRLLTGHLPREVSRAIPEADTIFVESGIALTYLPLLRRLAPQAAIIYLASDALDAIDQAAPIRAALRDCAALIDRAAVPSPLLRDEVPDTIPCHYVPHGVEKARFAAIGASPYQASSTNAVSVGSMLFDPEFFRLAAPLFPAVTFHVIGSGYQGPMPGNVTLHPEMPFEATLAFIRHADVAIAPYRGSVFPYLAHTSMKLMQYGYLGIPAVCPSVVATIEGRFGYTPGNACSIETALKSALLAPRTRHEALDWADVTARLLRPAHFEDAAIAA